MDFKAHPLLIGIVLATFTAYSGMKSGLTVAASNKMAFVLLLVLIIATIVPLLNSKIKNVK